MFPNKNKSSLSHLSQALFSFEDPKIRVPLYTDVHIAGLATLLLNLVGTCHCHRWRQRHYRLQCYPPSAHHSLADDQVSNRSNNSTASPLRCRSPSASTFLASTLVDSSRLLPQP
ncbi:hypothetical protein B296_00047972 [Ensete ventricosum]|uniref:Uncharacterized protein n=1 Tax=Ensete ventricosum TaxID=4639 RepID=A0A426XB46_ENSVE|nr:hypothetical protein B296_00047972 [Ensete ventricosum]